MPVLLDTNICIAFLNRTSTNVQRRLERLSPEEVFVSAVSVAELRYGADKSRRRQENHRVLDVLIGTIKILDFDNTCATVYGGLRAELEAGGMPIGPLDTLIAAQALAYRLTLVTHNEREFRRVPDLQIENWV